MIQIVGRAAVAALFCCLVLVEASVDSHPDVVRADEIIEDMKVEVNSRLPLVEEYRDVLEDLEATMSDMTEIEAAISEVRSMRRQAERSGDSSLVAALTDRKNALEEVKEIYRSMMSKGVNQGPVASSAVTALTAFLGDYQDNCRRSGLNMALYGHNTAQHFNVPTGDDCWQLCLDEASFECASAEYFYEGSRFGECNLSIQSPYTRPTDFRPYHMGILYYRCEDNAASCMRSGQDMALYGHNTESHTGIATGTDCWDLCVNSDTIECLSAEFFYAGGRYGECNLSVESPYTKPADFRPYNQGILYYQCEVVQSSCVRTGTDMALYGHNTEQHFGVPTGDDCWQLCLDEENFFCASAEYFYDGSRQGECNLSKQSPYTMPADFRPYHQGILYYRCQDEVDSCMRAGENMALYGHNTASRTGVQTGQECWELCVNEDSFVCASAEYFYAGDRFSECNLSIESPHTQPTDFRTYNQARLFYRCDV